MCVLRWPCSISIALDQQPEVVLLGASQTAAAVYASRLKVLGVRKWLGLAWLDTVGGSVQASGVGSILLGGLVVGWGFAVQ